MRDTARIDIVEVEGQDVGLRVVTHAPHVIELDLETANRVIIGAGGPPIEPTEDGRLALDSAGEVIYELVDRDRLDRRIGIYHRVHTDE